MQAQKENNLSTDALLERMNQFLDIFQIPAHISASATPKGSFVFRFVNSHGGYHEYQEFIALLKRSQTNDYNAYKQAFAQYIKPVKDMPLLGKAYAEIRLRTKLEKAAFGYLMEDFSYVSTTEKFSAATPHAFEALLNQILQLQDNGTSSRVRLKEVRENHVVLQGAANELKRLQQKLGLGDVFELKPNETIAHVKFDQVGAH